MATDHAFWRPIIDVMWRNHTIQETCNILNIDYQIVRDKLVLDPAKRALLRDVSMLADAREQILKGERQ